MSTRLPDAGFIYVVQCGEYTKIGKARNPAQRLKTLSTGNPYPITIVVIWRTLHMSTTERMLHSKYEHLRHTREWFSIPTSEYESMRQCEYAETFIDCSTEQVDDTTAPGCTMHRPRARQ